MMPDEKEKLLTLFDGAGRWCQEAEARDAQGDAVRFDDAAAVCWDITGAMCRLFGWRRACQLFPQVDRHITGRKRPQVLGGNLEVDSMAALQDFNDGGETTYEKLIGLLKSMPVWRGNQPSLDCV